VKIGFLGALRSNGFCRKIKFPSIKGSGKTQSQTEPENSSDGSLCLYLLVLCSLGEKNRYATKASYEGAFVKGKRHGQGLRIASFLFLFFQSFSAGKMVYLTGETLDGGWEDDLPHGKVGKRKAALMSF
jgi:hypothetical protein